MLFLEICGILQVWETVSPSLSFKVSATTFLSADVCPTILAYAQTDNVPIPSQYLPAGFKSDGLVDVSCYTAMVEGLTQYGVPHAAQLYEGFGHGDMGWKKPASTWIISQTLAFAREYLS